ncbi:hypothetical protein K8R42_00570 [bacterium]|nr:hypothetical protein [bacterium]
MKINKFKFIIKESDVNYYVWWTVCRDFVVSDIVKKYFGGSFKNHLILFENGNGNWATILGDWNKLGERLVKDIFDNNFDIDGLIKEHYLYGEKVEASCREIEKKNLSKIDSRYLVDWFNNTINDYLKLNEFGLVPVLSDVEIGFLTSQLKEILKNKKAVKQNKIEEILNQLITSSKENIFWQEETDLLKIAIKYKDIKSLENSQEFEEHIEKYKWINFGYLGPEWGKDDFILRLRELEEKGSPEEILKEHIEYLAKIKVVREKTEKEINLTEQEKFVFKVARDFSFIKNYRVGIRHYFCYISKIIFDALSKKLNIPIDVFYYANQGELTKLILGGIKDYSDILARKNFYCEYREGNNFSIFSKTQLDKIVEEKFIKEEIEEADELKGQPAFLGKVQGKVKIVLRRKDIDKVEEGDVLVAVYTDPNLLPAMKKAAAFITEQGGITSHAAIVAREMKKPCIIGTKIATKIFKDGDTVIVDANHGIIKIIK